LIGTLSGGITAVPIPAGAKSVRVSFDVSGSPSGSDYAYYTMNFYTATPTLVSGHIGAGTFGGAHLEETFAVPPTAVGYEIHSSASASHGWYVTLRADFLCDAPGTTVGPCCPPDPILTGLIMQLAQQLALVSRDLTLVQRQAVPFGYVPGANHTGLSGAGELAIADLLGARVTITATTPGTIGSSAGNPERLFGAGYVQWGSADGFTPRVWLDQVETLTFPPYAGAYTLLAYSLPPGVVVDILELEREP